MFQHRVDSISKQLRGFLEHFYHIEVPTLTVETPPRIEMGDLAFPFAFQLARVLRKAPQQIAQEVIQNIEVIDGVTRLEAAGGFVNLFLDRRAFFQELYQSTGDRPPSGIGEKIIVEHTNINPNKAAHIGHLRNAILGDTFVRLLKNLGQRPEVQNYIDNTGVQVADVVVGFHYVRGFTLSEVEKIAEPFDYYCWDLYAEVADWYAEDESRTELRRQVLASIEAGQDHFFELAEHVTERIVRAHLKTMDRIGVFYDLLPRESEILHLKFWDEAFRLLKDKKAIYYSDSGPHQGCWVMHLPGQNGEPDEDKIIVRSNGTVTYVGKDIAYQLWKFGLLGKTFFYSPFKTYPDDHIVWVTSGDSSGVVQPEFGAAKHVYNVIDVRQSYLQRVVAQGLRNLGYHQEAERSIHFSYEMVALSPACCSDLGIELSDADRNRPYVEVSGRRGLGVKADDLIDKLIEKSLIEVTQRQKDLEEEQRLQIARLIAVGALRYFMLKYSRTSVIAFDFDEALSFEGETGPYLQYSVVRSDNIFRKLALKYPVFATTWQDSVNRLWSQDQVSEWLSDNDMWSLLRDLSRIQEIARQAVGSLELSVTAKHAFGVAQQFNLFYHKHHILSEQNETKRTFYLTVAATARLGLLKLLDMLGIEVPERM